MIKEIKHHTDYHQASLTTKKYTVSKDAELKYGTGKPVSPDMESVIDKKFGKWRVIAPTNINGQKHSFFCRCDCGEADIIDIELLKSGHGPKCRVCWRKVVSKNHNVGTPATCQTWLGMVKLCEETVLSNPAGPEREGIKISKRWLCFESFLYDMGEKPDGFFLDRIVRNRGFCKENCRWSDNFVNNKSEKQRKKNARCRPIGYYTWQHMLEKCNNKKHIQFHNYGGKKIKVCERWSTFKNFLDDMGEKPDGFFLGRKDLNVNFCKNNCKWITKKEIDRAAALMRYPHLKNTRSSVDVNKETGKGVVNCFDVSACIFECFKEKTEKLTAMKLQSLLFYCQVWSLVWNEEVIFEEEIEAWPIGPVIKEIHEKHLGMFFVDDFFGGKSSMLSDKKKNLVETVVKTYMGETAEFLRGQSRHEGPWKAARKTLEESGRGNSVISLRSLHDFYSAMSE